MGINFNIVKKPKVEEDDGEELEEEKVEEQDDDKGSSGYDPRKKMFRFMALIVIVMIVLLLILFVISSLGSRRPSTYSYSEIEDIMEKAAKSYMKDNPSLLPDEDYSVEVDAADLANADKMKPLSEYPTKDGEVCTGSVSVQKEDDEYLYSPVLNCGDKYTSVSLTTKVINNNENVTSGDGLYSRGGEYVFRGENVNNYVQLDDKLWRIVKITNNDNIVLVSDESVGFSSPWDDRYNEQKGYETGINNYNVSRIKDYLDELYRNPSKEKYDEILSKNDKSKLVEYDLCIGKRTIKDEDRNNTVECKQTLSDQKMGLLTVSDYLYVSVDPNCKSIESKSCKNYNYLVSKKDFWLLTANSENTYEGYQVTSNGSVVKKNTSDYAGVRPVIQLNSSVLYKSGKGTLEKPYKVR